MAAVRRDKSCTHPSPAAVKVPTASTIMVKNYETNGKFRTKSVFQAIRGVLIFSLEVRRLLNTEAQLEDWALGCHPARNDHVTH